MMRNAWHISGGKGWCANSTCRRVLVTHNDGHQSVQEIKNDLGMKDDDFDAMRENLKSQGINDVKEIELASGLKSSSPKPVAAATPVTEEAPAVQMKPCKFDPRPSAGNQFHGRRAPGGQSSLIFG
jgi:hypothetical protein